MEDNLVNCSSDLNYSRTLEEISAIEDDGNRDKEIREYLDARMEEYADLTITGGSTSPSEIEAKAEDTLSMCDKIAQLENTIRQREAESLVLQTMNSSLQKQLTYMNHAIAEVAKLEEKIESASLRSAELEEKNIELTQIIECMQNFEGQPNKVSDQNVNGTVKKLKNENRELMAKIKLKDNSLNKAKDKIKQLTTCLSAKQDLLVLKENEVRSLKSSATPEPRSKLISNGIQTAKFKSRDHEIVTLKGTVEELQTKNQKLTQELAESKKKLDDIEDKFSDAVEKIGNMRTEISENDNLVDEKNEKIQELKRSLEDIEEEYLKLQVEKIELTEENAKLRKTLNEIKTEADNEHLKTKLAEALDQVNQLITQNSSSESLQKRLKAQVEQSESGAKKIRQKVETYKNLMEDFNSKMIFLESEQSTLESQITSTDVAINMACSQITELYGNIKELRKNIEIMQSAVNIDVNNLHYHETKHDSHSSSLLKIEEVDESNLSDSTYYKMKIKELTEKLVASETCRTGLELRINSAEKELLQCYTEIENLNVAMVEERESDKNINMTASIEKLQDEIAFTRKRNRHLNKLLCQTKQQIDKMSDKLPIVEVAEIGIQHCHEIPVQLKSSSTGTDNSIFEAKLETELLKREIEFRDMIQREFHAKLQNLEMKYKTATTSACKRQEEEMIRLIEQHNRNRADLEDVTERWNKEVAVLEKRNEELMEEVTKAKQQAEENLKLAHSREEDLVEFAKMMEKESNDTIESWKKITTTVLIKCCEGFCNISKTQSDLISKIDNLDREIAIVEKRKVEV